ncbi:serine hydrolase domain-containing protein [Aquimarina algicola]|uniref:Beta-lactamase family protein n=1 Tax=Aquimarina algicola TaxID=2589995 RepID=A0A504J2S6_9FLAO|nr:serine hydrolase domain-containing protein [Aquimarina algicola]TPN81389.1 beta-lactamase family protein [Aquimarina algicola]
MKKRFIIPPVITAIVLCFFLISAKKVQNKTDLSKEIQAYAAPPQNVIDLPNTPAINDFQKQKLEQALNEYFEKAIRNRKIVGAAVSIVKCDSIIFAGGFGKRNIRNSETIDQETIFRIGSVSKGFAGILTGIQVQEGLLDWNEKIVDHFPDFRFGNTKRTNSVTVSHVLSHATGLPYHSFTNLVEKGLSIEDISKKFRTIRPKGKLGKIYSYQNAAFALSGAMIEKVTQKTFSETIQEKIFDPLHMTSASTDYESLIKADNVARPHRLKYRRWRPVAFNKKYYNAIAAGGVNASATDMGKWMKLLLGQHPEIIENDILQKVFTPAVEIPKSYKYYQKWPGHISSSYGFGWRLHTFSNADDNDTYTMIHHGGYVNNFRSEIAIFPKKELGITVLFNSPTKLARTVIPDLENIIKNSLEMSEQEEMLAVVNNIQ